MSFLFWLLHHVHDFVLDHFIFLRLGRDSFVLFFICLSHDIDCNFLFLETQCGVDLLLLFEHTIRRRLLEAELVGWHRGRRRHRRGGAGAKTHCHRLHFCGVLHLFWCLKALEKEEARRSYRTIFAIHHATVDTQVTNDSCSQVCVCARTSFF